MRRLITASLLLYTLFYLTACQKVDPIDQNLSILFKGLTQTQLQQNQADSSILIIQFTDPSYSLAEGGTIHIRDSRDTTLDYAKKVPQFSNLSLGELQVNIPAPCCFVQDSTRTCQADSVQNDSLFYYITVETSHGAFSNQISTPMIYLNCQ